MTTAKLRTIRSLDRRIGRGVHTIRFIQDTLARMRAIYDRALAEYQSVEVWESEDARDARGNRLAEAEQIIEGRGAKMERILAAPWPRRGCRVDVDTGAPVSQKLQAAFAG